MAKRMMILTPTSQPTKEELAELKAAESKPIMFSEDAPELTEKELAEFKPVNPNYYRYTKEQITLRLDAVLIDAFKSTGKGYQTKINEALWKGASEMGIVNQH